MFNIVSIWPPAGHKNWLMSVILTLDIYGWSQINQRMKYINEESLITNENNYELTLRPVSILGG